MTKALVVVESPAKAKTIEKYLGKQFTVKASYGHVRDLIPKEGAVEPNNNFKMHYDVIEKNAKHVDTLAKLMKNADELYLATDPDREGEAISWHVYELLKERKTLKDKKIYRVVFHEITKTAIQQAIANPRDVSMDLVNAQQARRALDYLVGFNLSPLLWKKIRPGLSAGRVQSPALRLICEREAEIAKFIAKEYWTITAETEAKKQRLIARLTQLSGKKITQFSITDSKEAKKAEKTLTKDADGKLTVIKVDKKQKKRNPAAPFTTSTLQQEAARKLGFGADRTMRIAQQLYEGVDTDQGTVGLISYMRTDSVNLAQEAIAEIRDFITERYGKDNLPAQPPVYFTKSKNAQEAHEAIRPTSVKRTPESLTKYLNKDQLRLYELIWQRTMACQMIHATLNVVAIDLRAGTNHIFRANGSTIQHPGFMAVYREDVDDAKQEEGEGKLLPPLEEGDVIKLLGIKPEQHFTEPPPRYTEASLVKALEEFGIGRPSTYASIISTLRYREYVIMDNKRFKPTDVGMIVNKFLTNYFTQYVDYEFTAHLEDTLDAVARGEKEWIPLLKDFWQPFTDLVHSTEENVQRKDVTQEVIDEKCPKCSKALSIRLGRRGRFIGCSGYPECDYTRNLDESKEQVKEEAEVVEGRNCPQCNNQLVIKRGRYGKFIGCSHYPDCKFMEPLEKPKDTGMECPECKQGQMLQRKSRYGKIFFSCSRYPDCKYATWNEPIAGPCPKCNWPILTLKTTKRFGTQKVCPQKECGYKESVAEEG